MSYIHLKKLVRVRKRQVSSANINRIFRYIIYTPIILLNLGHQLDVSFLFQDGGFDYFSYIILPILIFLARIVDVSIGTLRIIFVSRSLRKLATVAGFVESLVWLIAVSQIVQNLTNVWNYLAFAGGFAAGNYIGIYLEGKLAYGLVCVRVITQNDASDLISYLQDSQFGMTSVSAKGKKGRVRLILSIIKRKNLQEMMEVINRFNPNAFISVEDVRSVREGLAAGYPVIPDSATTGYEKTVRK